MSNRAGNAEESKSIATPSFGSLDALVERAAELGAKRALEQAVRSDGACRYYRRASAPIESRAWDRAVAELSLEGKVFQPGREKLIRCDDLHAWIERRPIASALDGGIEASSGSQPRHVPYSDFRAAILRRAAR